MTSASPVVSVLDLGVTWRVGAEGPIVVSSPWFKAVAFLTSPGNDNDVAIVTFENCTAIKDGTPNDEVLHGHPLYEGLNFYSAHEVSGSPWVSELMAINSVHSGFDPGKWKDSRHFILTFQESTVEAIAKGWTVDTATDGLTGAAARMAAQTVA